MKRALLCPLKTIIYDDNNVYVDDDTDADDVADIDDDDNDDGK